MLEQIISKITGKNFQIQKFNKLLDNEKQFILSSYDQNDFYYCQKLFYYKYVKNFQPKYLYCRACQSPLQLKKILSDTEGYCSLKCSNNQSITKERKSQQYLIKFNVDNPQKAESIKSKKKITQIKNYGVDNPQKQKVIKDLKLQSIKKNFNVNQWQELVRLNSGLDYTYIHNRLKDLSEVDYKEFLELKEEFNCQNDFLYTNLRKYNINLIGNGTSILEHQVLEFVLSNQKFKIIRKARQVISPLELDIYIPKLKLAIEVNGDYWHQSSRTQENYHINKTNLCESKGIRLIHIWESECSSNKEFIQTLLTLYLENKVYQNEFQTLLEPFKGRLPRDYFQTLDFSGKIEEPVLEKSGNFDVYKTGYINVA